VEKERRRIELNTKKTDWEKYRNEVERGVGEAEEAENEKQILKQLIDILAKAAKASTPVKVIRANRVIWETAEIAAARRERNRLRRDMGRNRREWVEKSREVVQLTREAKRRVWREKLEDIKESKDTKRSWDLIGGLNGSKTGNKDSVAIVYRDRKCASNRAKANAFVQEYAETSSKRNIGKCTKEARKVEVELTKELRVVTEGEELEADFTMGELTAALNKLKPRKAAGPDGLKSDYIKRMPNCAKEMLLEICNYSWRTEWIPQEWRTATIIPILKKGKDPADVTSYRPIALTSHLGKVMERMINNRMTWRLEEMRGLSPWQSGFRRGRSTTDQCLRLSQRISDGFQEKPPQRTLLMLFDYRKAFDTVWRTGMLTKLKEKGMPIRFIRWIKAWLVNRTARVRVDGEESRQRVFKEGLPQGAVLSPLLFSVFIDDLLEVFEEDTLVSAFADDLAIAVSRRKKEEAEGVMQGEIRKVESWSKKWGLQLNERKCETCLFTTDTSEAKWTPALKVNNTQVPENRNPVFLGITYDPRLTFGKHVDGVCSKMSSRNRILYAIGGSTWGWTKEEMRKIYVATQRSVAEYAAPAWAPWTANSNKERLERCQRGAARVITGLTRSAPVEAVGLESGLESIGRRTETAAVVKYEQWRSMEEEDPRRRMTEERVVRRTRRRDWRSTCEDRLARIDGGEARPPEAQIRPERAKPWQRGIPYRVRLSQTTKRDTPERQREMAQRCLDEGGDYDLEVYTDGSATAGVERGGKALRMIGGRGRIDCP
jgi:hypothetical protein